jgi:hypothetical protein
MANSSVTSILGKIKRRLDYNSGIDPDLDAVLVDFLSDNTKILKQWLVDRGLRFETSAPVILTTTINQNYISLYEIPTAPTMIPIAVAGNLDGNYYYKVTFVSAYGESEASNTSLVVTNAALGTGQNTVTIPVSLISDTTSRNIYRTVAGGTVYKLLATVSDNTTATYVDNIADGALGTATAPDHSSLPSYSNIFKVTDRVNKKQVPIIPFDVFMGRYPDPTQIKSTMPDECAISGTRLYIGPTPSSAQFLYAEYDFVFMEISSSGYLFSDTQYDPLLIKMVVEDFFRRYYPKDRARIQTAFEDVMKTKDALIMGAKLTGVTQQSQSRRDQDVLIEPRIPSSVIYP